MDSNGVDLELQHEKLKLCKILLRFLPFKAMKSFVEIIILIETVKLKIELICRVN